MAIAPASATLNNFSGTTAFSGGAARRRSYFSGCTRRKNYDMDSHARPGFAARVRKSPVTRCRLKFFFSTMMKAHPPPVATSDVMMDDVGSMLKKLRQRWELASVLNFLHVFEPVIESDLKMSAEELEAALIEPNSTLAQLHTVLLKGIISRSTSLKSPDCWIICLSKTLAAWWPWVAEGDFPLAGAKGKEMSTYKELDSTDRLIILKALCEARADQPDVLSYINDALKDGSEVSTFQMVKLADDGKGNMFWYDGNETIGHRLYKEVRFSENKRVKGKGNMLKINCQWETLATNLEEFNKVVDEFSSSGVEMEVALSKSIEADILPILKKHWQKKQKALKLKQRAQIPAVSFRSSGITRSCRNQKPIDYRFDDYDRAITQAIQYTNKRKSNEEKQSQHGKRKATTSNESHNSETESEDYESNAERNHQGSDDDDAMYSSNEEYEEEKEDNGSEEKETGEKVESQKQNVLSVRRSKGLCFSKRRTTNTMPESMNLGAKNRLRQRPCVNTAVEVGCQVVADSEDEN